MSNSAASFHKLPLAVLGLLMPLSATPMAAYAAAPAAPAAAAAHIKPQPRRAAPAARPAAKFSFAPAPLVKVDFSAAGLLPPAAQADYGLGPATAPAAASRAATEFMCGPAAPAPALAVFAQTRIFAEPEIAAALVQFYRRRPQYLWLDVRGQIRPQARQILAYLAKAAADGLNPADYQLAAPAGLNAEPAAGGGQIAASQIAAAQFELGLSARLLRYASDMQSGRVKPAAFGKYYDLPLKKLDLAAALAAISAAPDPAPALAALRPQIPQYATLQWELGNLHAHLDSQSGGDSGKAELAHKAQLAANGLERLRWLPQNFPPSYVFVNIPAYTAYFMADNQPKLAMKAVVGSPRSPTVLFSAQVDRVVFNPSWGVPYSIMKNEMAARAAKDPSYISRHNYEIYRNGRRVSPESVNWAQAARTGNIHIRQKPGRGNALGQLKILFPNAHDIYMHDTPAQSAFGRDVRALSHGCIRLAQPKQMAAAVLGTDEKGLERYFKRPENGIAPPQPVAVYLSYFTAWPAEPDGPVRYYKDIYGLDAPLEAAEQAVSAARARAMRDEAASGGIASRDGAAESEALSAEAAGSETAKTKSETAAGATRMAAQSQPADAAPPSAAPKARQTEAAILAAKAAAATAPDETEQTASISSSAAKAAAPAAENSLKAGDKAPAAPIAAPAAGRQTAAAARAAEAPIDAARPNAPWAGANAPLPARAAAKTAPLQQAEAETADLAGRNAAKTAEPAAARAAANEAAQVAEGN